MTDEELIARLRNNPTDEEAALAATRIYNLGLLNDLAEANLEAEELTNWLKLKEAEARVERLEAVIQRLLRNVDENGVGTVLIIDLLAARAALKGDSNE